MNISTFITDPSLTNNIREHKQLELANLIANSDTPSYKELELKVSKIEKDELYNTKKQYQIKLFLEDMKVMLEEQFGNYTKFFKINIG